MRAIASVVAALMVVAALGWMVLRDRQAVVQDASPSERSAAQAATEESESRAAPVPSPSTPRNVDRPTRQPDGPPVTGRANADPLPPLDEPFAQHLDALRGRARDGDAPAACRLGMELWYCANLDDMRRMLAGELADSEGDDPAQQAGLSRLQDSVAQMEMRCRGVAPLDPLEAFRAQLAAARAGVVQSQLQLAAFPPLERIDVLDQVEVWREWRIAAIAGLESALAAGEPRAASLLALAYDHGDFGPFSPRLAAPDPYRAFVYRRLHTLIAQRTATSNLQNEASVEEKAGASLTEGQRRAAAADAQRLFELHYAALAPGERDNGINGDDFAACER